MISVLIATYNGEKFIVKQLDSIRQQSVNADEVIICDDCSQDSTVVQIKDYISKYNLSNWKLICNETNMGHYGTFLKLVSLASGDYIFFSDQDDIWHVNKIELLYQEIIKPGIAMAFSYSEFIDKNDNVISKQKLSSGIQEFPFHKLLNAWPSGYQTAYKSFVLKDILNQGYHNFSGFDYHDVLFGMLSANYGRVHSVGKILDSHRIHDSNVTFSNKSQSLSKTRESRTAYLAKVLDRYISISQIINQTDTEKSMIVNEFINFTETRIQLLTHRKLKDVLRLFLQKKYYKTYKDYISDILYAYNLHMLVRRYLLRR